MKELLKKLCIDRGVSGSEEEMEPVIRELLGDFAPVTSDNSGNIIVTMGDPHAKKHILLDAHVDRIGLTVTYLNE